MGLCKSILLLLALSSLLSFSVEAHVGPAVPPVSYDVSRVPTTLQQLPDLPSLSNMVSSFSASSLSLPVRNIDLSVIDPVVRTVCASTDYISECILGILPHLQESSGRTNPVSVLKMEMATLFEKANETVKEAELIKNDPSTPKAVSKVLDTCIENYESLLEDLQDASLAIESRDYGRLQSLVSATLQDIVTCSDAFDEEPGVSSPIAGIDEFLKKMCSNVLAISSMIRL